MALTVSVVDTHQMGDVQQQVLDVTFDNAYATAGMALSVTTAGFDQSVEHDFGGAIFRKTSDSTACIWASYNRTTSKLVAYWGNAGTASVAPEVTNGTDLSGYSGRLVLQGQ